MPSLCFASDNWAGAHPAIAAHLSVAAGGFCPAYGGSDLDQAVQQRFNDIFEREVAVFFVATGTAANALSLSAYGKPGSLAFAHRHAHVIEDECGAVEYLSGGGRLHAVDGASGRLDPSALEQAIARFAPRPLHAGRPTAVSLTQASEIGTVYTLDEIAKISDICKHHALALHLDGARFANALVALDTTPAEMTWRRGVDIVSFGGTKNGCWCAEAIILFDLERAGELQFWRKRAGQLFSKSRFIAAQFEAYFKDDLWLENARHANLMASRLAAAVQATPGLRLAWFPEANEIFTIMDAARASHLKSSGVIFHQWPVPAGFSQQMDENEALYRFVTCFATTEDDIARFIQLNH